jgi:acetolactate synthase-1/2/3 large subunit
VGRIGTLGTYGGNYALQNCDLLIEVGTRNNVRQVSYKPKTFAPQAKIMSIDIDETELNKLNIWKRQRGKIFLMRQDAKSYLQKILKYFNRKKIECWLPEVKQYNETHPIELTPPYKFIHDLTSLLPEGAVVVCGNGTACVAMFQAGIVKKGQRIFWNSGTASMGYALPAAIGACFANDKKEVICIDGDGSFMMNLQELQTIKHHNLPIKIFVLNNGGYHSIKMTQDNYFGGDYIGCNKESGVSFPNLAGIAKAFNFSYCWGDDMEWALRVKDSCLCEVFIGNDYVFKPKWTGGYDV